MTMNEEHTQLLQDARELLLQWGILYPVEGEPIGPEPDLAHLIPATHELAARILKRTVSDDVAALLKPIFTFKVWLPSFPEDARELRATSPIVAAEDYASHLEPAHYAEHVTDDRWPRELDPFHVGADVFVEDEEGHRFTCRIAWIPLPTSADREQYAYGELRASSCGGDPPQPRFKVGDTISIGDAPDDQMTVTLVGTFAGDWHYQGLDPFGERRWVPESACSELEST